jgi:hypothetical protein
MGNAGLPKCRAAVAAGVAPTAPRHPDHGRSDSLELPLEMSGISRNLREGPAKSLTNSPQGGGQLLPAT